MELYTFSTEELKNIFYTFGILTTFIIGSLNIFIALKNRKNSLRESLYKEQLAIVSKLMGGFYDLHSDLSKINTGVNSQFDLVIKIETIFGVLYSNTHIVSDSTVLHTINTLTSAMEFIKKSKNDIAINESFDIYFKNYKLLVQNLRMELGVEPLSFENQKLFKSISK